MESEDCFILAQIQCFIRFLPPWLHQASLMLSLMLSCMMSRIAKSHAKSHAALLACITQASLGETTVKMLGDGAGGCWEMVPRGAGRSFWDSH
jgi:hypothetical protein